MKKLLIPFFSILFFAGCNLDDNPTDDTSITDPDNEVPFIEGTKIVFVQKDQASKLLGTSDPYTKELSTFDIVSKTGNAANTEEEDYLNFSSQQALDWTEEEKIALKAQILGVKTKLEDMGLNLNFPEKISLLKSTMLEEGGFTSYTRENYIIIEGVVKESFMIHELFHIISRFNPETRNDLFKTINFVESNRIAYPEAIKDKKITNPDAPYLEHTINVQIDGVQQEAVFVLISEEEWDGGSFKAYMKQKLMVVEGGPTSKAAKLVDNKPVLKEFEEATDLEAKIGTNTSYTLHPEEILAEHFIMLVQKKEVPDPSFIDAMREVLQK